MPHTGIYRSCQRLTVRRRLEALKLLPSLAPLDSWQQLPKLLHYGIGIAVLTVVLCRLSQRVSVLSWSLTTVIKLFESFESPYTF